MSKEINVPAERYSCQSCGRCCTMWTITVDESRAEQLRRTDWGGGDPFIRRRGEGDEYCIRMVQGRCFFLDRKNRCRIHNQVGYESKPEGCKAFPLHVTQVAGETHVRLSFYCPAVTAQKGKRLQDQMKWVRKTVKSAGDVARKVPLQLIEDLELTLRDLESIERALVSLLEQQEHSIADGVAAGAGLLARLVQATGKDGKSALAAALRQAQGAGLLALAEEGRTGGSAARAGPVFSLFLGQDCKPGKLARMGHFFGVRLFNVGLSRLTSRMMGAKASRGAVRKVSFDPCESSEALLRRYLLHKLRSRRMLSGELTLVTGYNLLVAAYGIVNLLARLRAASEGRGSTNEEDITRAVQAADLLVVEHTALQTGSVMATLLEGVLAQQDLCASIMARIEGR